MNAPRAKRKPLADNVLLAAIVSGMMTLVEGVRDVLGRLLGSIFSHPLWTLLKLKETEWKTYVENRGDIGTGD